MLVILSFALVLVAVVLLVLGLLTGSGLALIYTSMACSLAAGIVLYVAIRVSKPRVEAAGVGTLSDIAPRRPEERPAAAGPTATAAVREAEGTVAVLERPDEPEPAVDEEPDTPARFDDEPGAVELDDDEEFFPIADYDDLSVSEIMPLLPELYPEELDVVEGRERATKARVTILNRIAELRDELAGRDDWGVPADGWSEATADAGDATAPVPAGPATPGGFPVDGYDDLTAAEVVARLDGLDADALREVRDREESGANRVTVLRAVGQALGEDVVGTRGAAKRAPVAKKSAAKKSAAKKSAAKRPAKKSAAKKSAAKKSAAKKSAKKSAAKKSTRGR